VGAVTVDWAGSLGVVLAVVSVFSGVVVGGGFVVDISCVGGIDGLKVVVSRIKPARMQAFSASRSMRCGGVVLAVVSVFSVFVDSSSVVGSVVVRNLI